MSELHVRSDMRVFCWWPKTGGGTLSAGIRSNPGVQWLGSFPNPDTVPAPSSRPIWVGGHTNFGLHRLYRAAPTYFTVLRDPIERLISEFFYHRAANPPPIFIPENERLPAFIRHVEAAAHLNYYCYAFADDCIDKETADRGLPAWDGDPAVGHSLIFQRADRHGFLAEHIPFHRVRIDETFQRATGNLRLMRFIGFFERLDETAACLESEFGLSVDLELRYNPTERRPRLEDLPAPVVAMLKRKTEADYAFVDAATRAPNAARPRCFA